MNEIFIFDSLNKEGYFENGTPTSEYFNRKMTITENETFKEDNRQYKYFVKMGGGKIGGIDKDGNGLTFSSQPRQITLIKENNKYKVMFGESYKVKYQSNYSSWEDDRVIEDGYSTDKDGNLVRAGEL